MCLCMCVSVVCMCVWVYLFNEGLKDRTNKYIMSLTLVVVFVSSSLLIE